MELNTLQDAFAYFADRQRCVDYVAAIRWPDGKVACPTCVSEAVTWMPTRFLWQCKGQHPKRQFSVKVGTSMEDSPISLSKWLVIGWMLTSCRNGISSYEVARTIGITQKSAWFMLHRLREGMASPSQPLEGEVEMDEAYHGPVPKNQHVKARKQGHYKNKTPIFGMVERGGRVIAKALPDAAKKTIVPIIEASVSKEAIVMSDAYMLYDDLRKRGFNHYIINHSQDSFVVGPVHTNTIENFWSCLKRTLKGTYIAVRPKHLNAYVQESAFRFNVRRGFSEQERFSVLVAGTYGKRLTYTELIARP